MKTTFFLLLGFITVIFTAPVIAQDKPLYIVTTTSQVGDLVKNITGETAIVDSLMGSGVDPHLYHPTRSDIDRLMKADLVFYNGMHLEGKMEDLLEKINDKKPTISIAAALSLDSLQNWEGSEGYDPHIWMNVQNWITGSKIVISTLSKARSDNANLYIKNAELYIEKLKELNRYAHDSIATIPQKNKVLITAHDAFGYFGSAYAIDVIGIQGISTESEAGLNKIETLVDALVTRNIPAVFVETSVGDHNIRAIIEGAKARGHDVVIGGSLYSDAMGIDGTDEATYIGMMRHNINTITTALGGEIYE